MKSLRRRLLVIIGGSLLVLWSLVAAWMLADLRSELRAALDDRLAASARMVAGLTLQFPQSPAPAANAAQPLMDVVGRDGVACEVSLLRGEVSRHTIARTASSPGLADVPSGYSTRVFGGKVWRTYVLQQGNIRVATADRVDMRELLLRDVALAAGVPFAVALSGSLLMLWFGIGGGLAPLERVRKLLEQRRPEDNTPLARMAVPRELAPLVGTITHLLERVRGAIARERRFTDDAAHELRTPLTAIKTHLQVLRLAAGPCPLPQPAQEALSSADDGVLRMERTLEQLLQLARLEGPDGFGAAMACDAGDAAREAIRDAEAAHGRPGQVRLEQPHAPLAVAAPCGLLAAALRNLLDNALRASPMASSVTLRAELGASERVVFSVLDRGPGLTRDECAQAVQRFWRRSPAGRGSGLGLSIVATIAERCGGTLALRPRDGGGLAAELSIPQASR
ncbi:ATP-binding protein [Ramlibacter sp.]|uniref:ATP-binding protein n=1 Tax=Ramlibacter sp. TaxID=1917967 RepID=UPI002C47DD08|nr:ATP-binding protein [Ramlibacter sp.]HWI83714.1 ATP-binding protein [Ramlibacter sp.]